MGNIDWYVEGPSYGNCNCGHSCPCQFEERPTHGDCRGFEVIEITKGHFADVDLAGTRAALIYAWPRAIFEGKGEMQVFIDYAADMDKRTAKVEIGDVLSSTGRPIQAPHGGGEHRVRIDIPGGIEFAIAEIGNVSTTSDAAVKLNLKDSFGQWHFLKHGPSGVVQ